jgi:hypothetical protein
MGEKCEKMGKNGIKIEGRLEAGGGAPKQNEKCLTEMT